jgi:hypothetical protein
VPVGRGEVEVIVGRTGVLMVIENGVGPAVPTELWAVALIVNVPPTVGVPLKSPDIDKVSPVGTPVAVHVIGEVPEAVN